MDPETEDFLRHRQQTVPLPVSKFEVQYHEQVVEVLEMEVGGKMVLTLMCPICLNKVALDDRAHTIAVNRSTGKLTVTPELVCPYGCGLYAEIKDSVFQV